VEQVMMASLFAKVDVLLGALANAGDIIIHNFKEPGVTLPKFKLYPNYLVKSG
jgi:hypothetical protein